jgi:Lar family restriction alleviation protein
MEEINEELKRYGEAEEAIDIAAIHEAEKRLLPCPFCGGSAVINYVPPHKHGGIAGFMPDCLGEHFIECTSCSCAIAEGNDLEAAIAAWNKRVTEGTND